MRIRELRYDGDLCYIPLTKGFEAVVDKSDSFLVKDFNWFCLDQGNLQYAARWSRVSEGDVKKIIFMHRVIARPLDVQDVDHRNHNGLDNRRVNLRCCTRTQNNQNLRVNSKNTTGYKGVYYESDRGLWCARIRVDGVRKNLGRFKTPEEAHKAYCEASKKYHKDFSIFMQLDN